MDLQLYSIDHAPRDLPIWQLILDDLGNPPPERIARTLGVAARSVYRWSRDESAPRMACLALWWLTRWGRSAVDAQATNDARVAVGLANALHDERNQLRDERNHLRTVCETMRRERDRLRLVVARFAALMEPDEDALLPHAIRPSAGGQKSGFRTKWKVLLIPSTEGDPEAGDLDAALRALDADAAPARPRAEPAAPPACRPSRAPSERPAPSSAVRRMAQLRERAAASAASHAAEPATTARAKPTPKSSKDTAPAAFGLLSGAPAPDPACAAPAGAAFASMAAALTGATPTTYTDTEEAQP